MTFGKIHDIIFGSSIMEEDITVRYVFMCMITMADKEGFVDATIEALSRRFNVSVRDMENAINRLLEPDLSSRTPESEGRRIEPIRKTFGWKIVNYQLYRDLKTDDDRREYMKLYMRKYRQDKDKSDVNVNKVNVNSQLARLRHTDTDTDTDIKDIQNLHFVLRDNSKYELEIEKIKQYQKTYPDINVMQCLRECAQWNIDNPERRKTARGILKHINSWLQRAQKDKPYIAEARILDEVEKDTRSPEEKKAGAEKWNKFVDERLKLKGMKD